MSVLANSEELAGDLLDQEAVLRDRKCVCAFGLPVPPSDTCQTMGDIDDFDIERGWVQQVEPAAAEHALPGPGSGGGGAGHRFARGRPQVA